MMTGEIPPSCVQVLVAAAEAAAAESADHAQNPLGWQGSAAQASAHSAVPDWFLKTLTSPGSRAFLLAACAPLPFVSTCMCALEVLDKTHKQGICCDITLGHA